MGQIHGGPLWTWHMQGSQSPGPVGWHQPRRLPGWGTGVLGLSLVFPPRCRLLGSRGWGLGPLSQILLFSGWRLLPLQTPRSSASQATDGRPCAGVSAELCCSGLEACQSLSFQGPQAWPHAPRQAEFLLEEWGSEFSSWKLGLWRGSQWGSQGQLSVVGAGAPLPTLGQSESQQNRTKKS